jgi:hypothetical protein
MHRRNLFLVVFISLISISLSVQAQSMTDAMDADVQQDRQAWDRNANNAELLINLPAVDPTLLVEQVETHLVILKQQQQELTAFVDRSKLGTKDAMITAIMPGGLLYAAYKKSKLEQARTELSRITEEMGEMARDLLVFEERTGKLSIAQLQ